jgi:hypothetical protein
MATEMLKYEVPTLIIKEEPTYEIKFFNNLY